MLEVILAAALTPILFAMGYGCRSYFTSDHEKESNELRNKMKQQDKLLLEQSITTFNQAENVKALWTQCDILQAQRDDYKKIAATHTVTYPSIEPVKVETTHRTYQSTIDKNLKNLKKDLDRLVNPAGNGGGRFNIEITISIEGKWKEWLVSQGWTWHSTEKNQTGIKTAIRSGLKFGGEVDEVLDEITTYLKDPYYKLWSSTSEVWYYPDSPFEIACDITYAVAKDERPAEVKIVEVLRVEKEIQIVEIEKKVLVESSIIEDKAPVDIKELIASQVEVELDLRLNGRRASEKQL